ncbi:MAG TPA: hypothetical protein VIJ25_11675, partial [Methylococcales bacterium]
AIGDKGHNHTLSLFMDTQDFINQLCQFREHIYTSFSQRQDSLMDLLDLALRHKFWYSSLSASGWGIGHHIRHRVKKDRPAFVHRCSLLIKINVQPHLENIESDNQG